VGTRFVASHEAIATRAHKQAIVGADHGDIVRTVIYSGRPMRVLRTPYIDDWERNRQPEIAELTAKGIIPNRHEMERYPERSVEAGKYLMGNVAALINDILPAQTIVDNMVSEAARILQDRSKMVGVRTKL
jgi:NAD(P)H-dependent flavin oxidoreductase YrpB (nitropropane dioxygenase family)